MQSSNYRKPITLLLFAGLILAAAIVWRVGLDSMVAEPENGSLLTIESLSQDIVGPLQARLQENPDDTRAYTELGLALTQDARMYDDTVLYNFAEQAFQEALQRDPNEVDALMGMGIVYLTRHDFPSALEWAEQARALNPFRAQIVGIMVDANVELGRYDEAVTLAQAMVDLRPDVHSYSRISYIREIHGEAEGAIDAMQMAVDVGLPGSEPWLWSLTHLGHLYFEQGDLESATASYERVLQLYPDYLYAQAGLATVEAALGKYQTAIETYESIVQELPLSGFLLALGELYEVTGQPDQAQEQYTRVGEIEQQNVEAGIDVELELALYKSEYTGELESALAHARGAYEERPSIFAADTLAWVLYRNGEYDEAWRLIQEALRFDIREAPFHYHAGMIAHALGNEADATKHLAEALTINPYFSITDGPAAQTLLASLDLSLSQAINQK